MSPTRVHTLEPAASHMPLPTSRDLQLASYNEGELNYVSKYLIQYIPVKPQKVSAAGKHTPGARVLTSDKCVKILVNVKRRKERN